MSRKSKEPVFDDDNPEWTKEDFAKARPPAEVYAGLPAAFRAARLHLCDVVAGRANVGVGYLHG